MPTRADRNNNPGNIKVPSGGLAQAQQMYGDPGLSVDPTPASDGGYFLKFSSPQYGDQATTTHLTSPTYSNMTVDQAMKTWSGGGYDGSIAPDLANKPVSSLSPSDLQNLKQSIYKKEGYAGDIGMGTDQQAQQKLSLEQFGQKVQSKYWQYANLDPTDVAKRVLAKYPQYAQSVDTSIPADTSTQNQTSQNQNNTQDQSLGTKLSGRASDISSNLSDLSKQLSGQKGSQGWWSDLIQSAGDVGGGIGDIVNAGLELIPGVKQAEGYVGSKIGQAAGTPIGQQIVGAINSFNQAHPELSKDIAAGFNIATPIPILRGLGVVKDVDGLGLQGLRNWAVDASTNDLGSVVAKAGKLGSNIMQDTSETGGKALIKDNIVNQGLHLTDGFIDQNGKYATQAVSKVLDEQIGAIDDNELTPALRAAGVGKTAAVPSGQLRVSLADMEKSTLKDATDNLIDAPSVSKMFAKLKAKYGDYLSLEDVNNAKRDVSKFITDSSFADPDASANKLVRSTLQKTVEEKAKALNLPNVNAINKKIGNFIKTQKILDVITGK